MHPLQFFGIAASAILLILPPTSANVRSLTDCSYLGPVFPIPLNPSKNAIVKKTAEQIEAFAKEKAPQLLSGTLASLAIQSVHEDEPLVNFQWTAAHAFNKSGTHRVTEDSVFRIGSITKVFTTTALLQLISQGKVNQMDPVAKYIPELRRLNEDTPSHDPVADTRWNDVTVDALMSQLSGISADVFDDIANDPSAHATKFGLPAVGESQHTECGTRPTDPGCTKADFFKHFGKRYPIFAPYASPAYSDIAFDILGLVIENVTGDSWHDYVDKHIISELGLNHTSTRRPAERLGAIPAQGSTWSTDMGFSDPTGGIYSSTTDLLALGRAILTNRLFPSATTNAWLKPRSHTASLGFSVGAPWEIVRSNRLSTDGRNIDLYTKSGGIGSYRTLFFVLPDYGLTGALLTAGSAANQGTNAALLGQVLEKLVPAVEGAGREESERNFAGHYMDEASNSSIVLEVQEARPGLRVAEWRMRGVDVLENYSAMTSASPAAGGADTGYLDVRLYPSGLESQHRSAWRAVFNQMSPKETKAADQQLFFFQGSCQSWTAVDEIFYGLRSFDEFVFGFEDGSGRQAVEITPRVFRQTLRRAEEE